VGQTISLWSSQLVKRAGRFWASRSNVIRIDLNNRAKYGADCPRFAERIYVTPENCYGISTIKKRALGWGPHTSGKVVDQWPNSDDVLPITSLVKIQFCLDHWVNGVVWEHTGAYEYYAKKGKNLSEIVAKYRRLDVIFEDVKAEGRLKNQQELNPNHFRELDGIRINIGPAGQLIFADGGTHRLAMAIVLGLGIIPAQVGCVHTDALREMPKLRSPSNV
jgi:hypothetical protein